MDEKQKKESKSREAEDGVHVHLVESSVCVQARKLRKKRNESVGEEEE